eukprot:TRINITY_DN97253_c0_g1_i1.p1 TRINITY_DN97253_c0_g1~~TRINITY_DN97253_c0_g1_i1.p1  ORF type:complete len:170 (-),score=29.79 TRINITY_DN97253_c0_g1_i1:104-589(-)
MALGAGGLIGVLTAKFDCACFPRDCYYDEEEDACFIGAPLKNASKNPYGQALPGQGFKCVPYENSKTVERGASAKTCRYESCTATDYATSVGQDLANHGLFGQIGRTDDGKGLMNCLSKGSPSNAMMLEAEFPDSTKNTPERRSQLFSSIGLKPKPDAAEQ